MKNIFSIIFRTYGTETLDKTRVYKPVSTYLNKPSNGSGLFASPACEEGFETWASWCRGNDYALESLQKWVDFRLNPSAKVLVIQSPADVRMLPKQPGFLRQEVNFNCIFEAMHYDAIYINYAELSQYYEDDEIYDFIYAYDCDTLFVRNIQKIEICHKRQYIYLSEESWAKKVAAKKAHKGLWAKGYIDGEYEEVTFFFAHGSSDGALEFAPDSFTDHPHISKMLEEKASSGKFSQKFYQRHANDDTLKELVLTHSCHDGLRSECISKNFMIRSATPFKGCTFTQVEGRSTRRPGFLIISICECFADE